MFDILEEEEKNMQHSKKMITIILFTAWIGIFSAACSSESHGEVQRVSEQKRAEFEKIGNRLLLDDGYFLMQYVGADPDAALAKAFEAQKTVPKNTGWYLVVKTVYAADTFKAKSMEPQQRKRHFKKVLAYLKKTRKNLEEVLHTSLNEKERKGLKLTADDMDMDIAWVSVETEDLKEAKRLAEEKLEKNTATASWKKGDLVNRTNTILGRVALREGDMEKAKIYLQRSSETTGSPVLNSFGPSYVLAKELLKEGEKKAVLDYLDSIALFWIQPSDRTKQEKRALLKKWKKIIESGGVPDDPSWR
jgi:tetratricopeptide (TPR) repeat protein